LPTVEEIEAELDEAVSEKGGGPTALPAPSEKKGRQDTEFNKEKATAKRSPKMTAANSTEPEKLDLRLPALVCCGC